MDKMKLLLEKTKPELEHWEKTRKWFIETKAFHECKECLKKNGHLNLIGASGDGKTSMAMELLRQSPRTAIILREAKQWEDIDINNELIVLIEDIFGGLSLSKEILKKWLKKANNMYCVANGGTVQIIMTCRENIYMSCEKELGGYELFKTKNANIHLSGPDSDSLTRQERDKILTKYIELSNPIIVVDDSKVDSFKVKTEWRINNKEINEIVEVETGAVGFPQCCKAFVSDFECFKRGKDFFSRPFEVIEKIIDIMCQSDDKKLKFDYCVLGSVLIYGQLIDECIEEIDTEGSDAHKNVVHVGRACKLQTSSIMSQNIRDAGNRLKTSYLTYSNNTFSFQHNSMLEAVFSSFFKTRAPLLIELCKWEVLKSLVSTGGCTTEKNVCVLPPRHYKVFSIRLITELTENSKDSKYRVVNVLSHRVLTDTTFVNNFFTNLSHDQASSLVNKVYYVDGVSGSILYWTCVFGSVVFLGRLVPELQRLWSTEKLEEEFKWPLPVACFRDDYDLYQYITTHTDIRPDGDCLCRAANCGSLQIVTDLIDNHKPWNDYDIQRALSEACEEDNYDVYQYITTHTDIRPGGRCLCLAAFFGHLQIVTDLIEKHKPWDNNDIQRSLSEACRGGEFDVYKLLMADIDARHVSVVIDDKVLKEAAYGAWSETGRKITSDLSSRGFTIPL